MTKVLLTFVAVLVCSAIHLTAGTVCPPVSSPPGVVVTGTTGCNVLITFDVNGVPTVTVPNTTAYDGCEDQLVGVINNSNNTIGTIPITGPPALFGFDGDGICSASGYIASSSCTTADTSKYGPNGVTFTGINANQSAGNVNFNPPIAAGGGTGFFSLELAPNSSSTGGVQVGGAVPEPRALSLFCAALLGIVVWARKRRTA